MLQSRTSACFSRQIWLPDRQLRRAHRTDRRWLERSVAAPAATARSPQHASPPAFLHHSAAILAPRLPIRGALLTRMLCCHPPRHPPACFVLQDHHVCGDGGWLGRARQDRLPWRQIHGGAGWAGGPSDAHQALHASSADLTAALPCRWRWTLAAARRAAGACC